MVKGFFPRMEGFLNHFVGGRKMGGGFSSKKVGFSLLQVKYPPTPSPAGKILPVLEAFSPFLWGGVNFHYGMCTLDSVRIDILWLIGGQEANYTMQEQITEDVRSIACVRATPPNPSTPINRL